jgi:hypothetical protein
MGLASRDVWCDLHMARAWSLSTGATKQATTATALYPGMWCALGRPLPQVSGVDTYLLRSACSQSPCKPCSVLRTSLLEAFPE